MVLLVLLGCGEPPVESAAPLNLLLVTLDTTRADHMGMYGYHAATSPNLDQLAQRGVAFQRAYAPMAQTFPTHSTILSGLGPREHGVLENHRELPERVVTIAQSLRAQGWATAGFIGAKVLSSRTGIHRGFDHWDETMPVREAGRATAERPAEQVVDAVLTWFDERTVSAASEPQAWFAWIHFFDAHQPYLAPDEVARTIDPALIAEQIASDPGLWLGSDRSLTPAVLTAIAERWAEYDAEVAHADAQLGRVLSELEARGELNNTVIAVVGDHGEGLTTHGEFGHGVNLYDELMRVPLVIAAPDGAGAGSWVAEPFALRALRPLLEGMLLSPEDADSSWATLTRRGRLPSEPVFLERPHFSAEALVTRSGKRKVPYAFGSMVAVVHEGWKLLREPDGREWLFDLSLDPGEVHDCVAEQPELRARLAGLLDEWLLRYPVSESGPVELSDERLRELEALGYLK